MKVQVNGQPPTDPPKPVNKEVIKDQGSVPYPMAKARKTPNTAVGKSTTGKKRGMGAALRGSRYTRC